MTLLEEQTILLLDKYVLSYLNNSDLVALDFGWSIQPNLYIIYVKKKPTHFSLNAEGLKPK